MVPETSRGRDKISRLEAIQNGLQRQMDDMARRLDRELVDIRTSIDRRHEENGSRFDKLVNGQETINNSISQMSGGVAVVRNIIHVFWIIIGAVTTLVGQYFLGKH